MVWVVTATGVEASRSRLPLHSASALFFLSPPRRSLSLSLSCFFRLFQRLLPSAVNRYAAISASCSSTRIRALRCISSPMLPFSPDFSHPSLPIPPSAADPPSPVPRDINNRLFGPSLFTASVVRYHALSIPEMIYIVFYSKFILPVGLVNELSPFRISRLNSLSLIAAPSHPAPLPPATGKGGKGVQLFLLIYRTIRIADNWSWLSNDASLYLHVQPIRIYPR